jgi:hypothetical protein
VLLQHVANFGLEGLAAVSEQLDVIPEQACARWCALAAQQNTAKRNQRSTWTPAELAVVIKVRQNNLHIQLSLKLCMSPGKATWPDGFAAVLAGLPAGTSSENPRRQAFCACLLRR